MAKGQQKKTKEVRKPKKAEPPKLNAASATRSESPVPNLVKRT